MRKLNLQVPLNISSLVPYPPGKPIEELERELGISGSIKLASNENPLGPSRKAVEAAAGALAGLHRYPDGSCYYLKEKLSSLLGVSAGMIILGNGSNEIIELLIRAFVRPGDEAVMGEPSFAVYPIAVKAAGGVARAVPLERMRHDLDAMASAINSRTKLVFVANPNNPTGTMVDQAAVDRFVAQVPDNVVTVFDEAYMELLEPGIQVDTVKHVKAGKKPVITLRTFSKAYGLAGLRVGYALAQPDAIDLLNKVRQPFNVTAMAQAAAVAALEDEEYLVASRQMLREGRRQLMDGMRKLGLEPVESVTNFILFPFKKAAGLTAALTKRKVIVRPMAGFGLPEHVRVSVGTAKENAQFLRALSEALIELK